MPSPRCSDAGGQVDANLYCKLYFHAVGTDQSEDVLIYEEPDNPKWMTGAEVRRGGPCRPRLADGRCVQVSDDGRQLLLYIRDSTDPENHLYFADISNLKEDLKSGGVKVVKAIPNFDAAYTYTTNIGSKYYFMTNKNAPRYRVVCLDLDDPASFENPVEVDRRLL